MSTIAALLDLERVGDDVFASSVGARMAPAEVGAGDNLIDGQRERVYGGQVVAQALAAAVRTVDGRAVQSLHAYFVAGAVPGGAIHYAVERVRDGRSVTNRQVRATQDGRVLLTLGAAFHDGSDGVVHQDPMPQVPDPETLPASDGAERFAWSSIDLRFVDRWIHDEAGPHVARRTVWMRVAEALPWVDDCMHACALTYASDLSLIRTALAPHAAVVDSRGIVMASLDHSIWFHRPVRADEWLLYSSVSPSASRSRALAIGYVFRRDGELAATVVQEGLLRVS
ncbi:MAG: acyl-CoA thioesterase II [Candidatus Dormibacteria bacterium]